MLCWFLLHNSVSQLCLHVCSVAQSCPTFLDPMDCSHQAPLSMGFPGQEYWRGFPFPSPEDLPNPGIEPVSLVSPALAGGCFPLSHLGSLRTYCFKLLLLLCHGLPRWLSGKESTASVEDAWDMGLIPGLGRSPGVGNGNLLQCSCLENPHGQRSLVGYSPWGHKESDRTERLHFHFDFISEYSSYLPIAILRLSKTFRRNLIF